MRIAIIGSGISGMLSAWLLHRGGHEVTVYEAGSHIGGHTNTVPVTRDGVTYPVDTGFIVFNDWTYPNFIRLLDQLGVASRPTTMSFSVRSERDGLEYNGTNLNTLFAQRRNLFRPSFHRMIRDILRFGREAPTLLAGDDDRTTLQQYLDAKAYSREFIEHYIIPMGGAIWSAPDGAMRDFPVRYFVQFFRNHGMLNVDDRPQWRVVEGGSWSYVQPLVAPFRERIHLNMPISAVRRSQDGVAVVTPAGAVHFDEVVLATHGDQALGLLANASAAEREVLGAFTCQPNEAILHTDESLMPRSRRAWAAWNYHLLRGPTAAVPLTYNMNMLQGIRAPCQFLVTLNHDAGIDPTKVIRRIQYRHPRYTTTSVQAQRRWSEINGMNRTWFCGAYWGYGFHEDGVVSALRVAAQFGLALPGQTTPAMHPLVAARGVLA